jgi:hypothetical protein
MTYTASGTGHLTPPDNGFEDDGTAVRDTGKGNRHWRHFSSICRQAIWNAGYLTR